MLGYAQFIANKYKRMLQEGELFKTLKNSPSAYMEYIKTVPTDRMLAEAQAIGIAKGSDIQRWLTQGPRDLLALPKSLWANMLIAVSNATSGKEKGVNDDGNDYRLSG
jgi:hypothetical protein